MIIPFGYQKGRAVSDLADEEKASLLDWIRENAPDSWLSLQAELEEALTQSNWAEKSKEARMAEMLLSIQRWIVGSLPNHTRSQAREKCLSEEQIAYWSLKYDIQPAEVRGTLVSQPAAFFNTVDMNNKPIL